MELQIKNIMQQQGRTNQWLADQLGTSAQYAGQVAKGSNGATLAQYERIADALGVKLWQLFAPVEDYVLREDHDRHDYECDQRFHDSKSSTRSSSITRLSMMNC